MSCTVETEAELVKNQSYLSIATIRNAARKSLIKVSVGDIASYQQKRVLLGDLRLFQLLHDNLHETIDQEKCEDQARGIVKKQATARAKSIDQIRRFDFTIAPELRERNGGMERWRENDGRDGGFEKILKQKRVSGGRGRRLDGGLYTIGVMLNRGQLRLTVVDRAKVQNGDCVSRACFADGKTFKWR